MVQSKNPDKDVLWYHVIWEWHDIFISWYTITIFIYHGVYMVKAIASHFKKLSKMFKNTYNGTKYTVDLLTFY